MNGPGALASGLIGEARLPACLHMMDRRQHFPLLCQAYSYLPLPPEQHAVPITHSPPAACRPC